jgi:hypothetical protein
MSIGLEGAAFTLLLAPLLSLVVLGVLVLALRWTFAKGKSVVPGRARAGGSGDYGILMPASQPATFIEAERDRAALTAAGIRATLAPTTDGPRVLVFPKDLERARGVLRSL